VEQLVGDLGTDDDVEEEQLIEQINDNTWAVHGSASLEEISEELNVSQAQVAERLFDLTALVKENL